MCELVPYMKDGLVAGIVGFWLPYITTLLVLFRTLGDYGREYRPKVLFGPIILLLLLPKVPV